MDKTETETDAQDSPPVKKPSTSPGKIVLNVSDTKYAVVKYVGKKMFGWKLSYKHEDMEWDVMWTDNAVDPERLTKMRPYQKINHFPGMYSLARKNHLARNLMKLRRVHPAQYNFFPKTWLVPAEHADLKAYMTKPGKKKTFIVKPEASCQGRGIFLTRRIEDIRPDEHYVVQQYLSKPFLIDDFKFDLRVYVLVAGCDPLRIFVHEEGLARLATEKYVPPGPGNLADMCMHLTNYAVNKNNPNFIFNESSDVDDVGHKRSLTSTMKMFAELGYDVGALWGKIYDMVVKTLCAVQPSLSHTYRSCQPDDPYNSMCFELLGLDVILDHRFRPYLLEVNHSPSFTADTPLDKKIKRQVISEALTLMHIDAKYKRKYLAQQKAEAQERALRGRSAKQSKEAKEESFRKAQIHRDKWENSHLGGFTKVYPREDAEQYLGFIATAAMLWNEWTGGKKHTVPSASLSRAITPQVPGSSRARPPGKGEEGQQKQVRTAKLRSASSSELPEAEDSSEDRKRADVFDRLSKPLPRYERAPGVPLQYANVLPIDPTIYRAGIPRNPSERHSARQATSQRQIPPLAVPKTSVGLIRTLQQVFEQHSGTTVGNSPLSMLSIAPKPLEVRPKSEIGRGTYIVPRVMSFTPRSQGKLQP